MTTPQARALDDDPRQWLGNTPQLEWKHPRLRLLAVRLTQLSYRPHDKALALFRHVRQMPFGCVGDGTGVPALTVLRLNRGDCHTKSTLLVALLRAIGLPARLRLVSLKPDFLQGIIDLGQNPVEHCQVEVWLEDHWVRFDSHVMDPPLVEACRTQLTLEGRTLGYGLHLDGAVDWDGQTEALSPTVAADDRSLPVRDWGCYDDPYSFYSSTDEVRSKLGWSSRMVWMLGARRVNQRVHVLRTMAREPVEIQRSL